jgi:hypothetical protein
MARLRYYPGIYWEGKVKVKVKVKLSLYRPWRPLGL